MQSDWLDSCSVQSLYDTMETLLQVPFKVASGILVSVDQLLGITILYTLYYHVCKYFN